MSEVEIGTGGIPSNYGVGTITGVLAGDGLLGSAYSGVALVEVNHDYPNTFSVGQSVVVNPAIAGLEAFSAIALGAGASAVHAETYALDATSIHSVSTYGLPASLEVYGSSYVISGGLPTAIPIISEALRLSKLPYDMPAIGTGLSQNFYIRNLGFVSTIAGSIKVILTDPLDASFGSSMSLFTSSSANIVESLKLQGVYASFLSGAYLNFGSISGIPGYGIRDFGGKIQFRHASGLWSDMGSGGGGSDVYNTLHYSLDGKFCNIESDGSLSGIFVGQRLFASSPIYGIGPITMRAISELDLPIIPIERGGTGSTTATGALLALLPSHVTADANKVLALDDTATYAVWADASATGISHAGLTNLSFSTSGHLAATSAVANTFICGPISGANAAPTFRVLSVYDIPILTDDRLPIVPIEKGGTNANTAIGAMLNILPSITGNNDKLLKVVDGNIGWASKGILPIEDGGTGSNTSMGALLGLLPTPLVDNAVLTVNGSIVGWEAAAEGGADHSGLTNLSFNADVSGHFSASNATVANTFIAGPVSGANGVLSLRKITSTDLLGISIAANDLPIIEIEKGGTGSITAIAAIKALLPSQTSASGLYLKSDGINANWASLGSSFVDLTTTQSVAGLKTFTNLSSFNSNVAIKSSTTPFPYMTLAFSGAATTMYTFPVPLAGGFLTTNASGVLSWGTPIIALADLPVVSILKGGTGQTTAQLARNALLPAQSGNSGRFLTSNGTDVSWSAVSGFVDLTTAQTITGLKTFTNFQLKNATNFVDNFYTSAFTAQNHVYGLPVNVQKPGTGSTFVLGYLESNCNSTWNGSVWTDTTTLDWIDIGTNYFTLFPVAGTPALLNPALAVSNKLNSFVVGLDRTKLGSLFHQGKVTIFEENKYPRVALAVRHEYGKWFYGTALSQLDFDAWGICAETSYSSTWGENQNTVGSSDYRLATAAIVGNAVRGALAAAFRTVRPLPFHYNSNVTSYASNPLDKRYINDYDGPAVFVERLAENSEIQFDGDYTWTEGPGSLPYNGRTATQLNGCGVSIDFTAGSMTGVSNDINHGWPDARIKTSLNISGTTNAYSSYPSLEFYLNPSSTRHSFLTFKPWPVLTLNCSPISPNGNIDPIPLFSSILQGKSLMGHRVVNSNFYDLNNSGAQHVIKYTFLPSEVIHSNALWVAAYGTTPMAGFGVSQAYMSGVFSASTDGLGVDIGPSLEMAHTVAKYVDYPSRASFGIRTRSGGVIRNALSVKLDAASSIITEISQHDGYDAAITIQGTDTLQQTKINRLVIGAGDGNDSAVAGRLWIQLGKLWFRDANGAAHQVTSS